MCILSGRVGAAVAVMVRGGGRRGYPAMAGARRGYPLLAET
jgi:hypothetical protein